MSRARGAWLLVVTGVLLWLVAVLPAYYVVHRPLAFEPAPAPTATGSAWSVAGTALRHVADLLLLSLTVIVAAAWGNRVARWLGLTFASGLERWSLAAILGLGLLGTLVFFLGIGGGLYRGLAYGLLLALGLAALPDVRALLAWLLAGLRAWRPSRTAWPALYAGAVGLLALAAALLPPTGWDALVYHLQGPRLYLTAHRLVAAPDNFYLNWPAQVEMLFAWGLLLSGDVLAKLLHWVFWPLTGLLLYALARRATGETRVAGWSLVLWASLPFAAELAGLAYVDLGLTAFVLAGTYAVWRWTEEDSDHWLWLSALMAGLAAAAKYTAITWLFGFVLVLAHDAWRRQRRSAGWILRRAAGMGLVAGLALAPWLLKNWVVTGNPVYPFVFGGAGWNSTREAWLTWPGHSYSHNPLDYLALPWLMTVLGSSGSAAFDATLGPLLLCLVPLVALARGRPRAVNLSLALIAIQFLFFVIMIARTVYLVETRLLLPAFPLLCLVGAYGFVRLAAWDRPTFRLSRVVGGLVLLVLVLGLLTAVLDLGAVRPLAPLLGLESRPDYGVRRLGAHAVAMTALNQELPPGARTLFLWEPRGYYAGGEVWADATLDNLAQLRRAYPDPAQALAALRAGGVTHVLLYRTGLGFLRGPTPLPPTLSRLLRPRAAAPAQSLYPIAAEDVTFLDNLTGLSTEIWRLDDIYQLYRLP